LYKLNTICISVRAGVVTTGSSIWLNIPNSKQSLHLLQTGSGCATTGEPSLTSITPPNVWPNRYHVRHVPLACGCRYHYRGQKPGCRHAAQCGGRQQADQAKHTRHTGGIGGTYGANPVSCSAALAVFDIIESEDLLKTAQDLGVKLRQRLDRFREQKGTAGRILSRLGLAGLRQPGKRNPPAHAPYPSVSVNWTRVFPLWKTRN
jgi:hypothetical protein